VSGRHFDSGKGEEVTEKIDEEKEPSPFSSTTLEASPTPGRHESHEGLEYPESRKSPKSLGSHEYLESHEYPVSPVSNGQEPENELEALAVRCACTCAEDNVREKRFEFDGPQRLATG
jgi:hypothetical protein